MTRSGHGRPPVMLGLVKPYFGMFDDQLGSEHREACARRAGRVQDALREAGFDVIDPGLVDSVEAGRAAAAMFDEADLDVFVVVPTMAAPPAYAAAAIGARACPVVAWSAPELGELPPDLDQRSAHADTAHLGVIMLQCLLRQDGHAAIVVHAPLVDGRAPDRLVRAITACVAAARLRSTEVARIGGVIDGYDHAAVDELQLGQGAMPVTDLASGALDAAFDAVTAEQIDAERRRVASLGWAGEPPDDRSLQLSVALARTAGRGGRHRAVALNCHGPQLRDSDHIGIVACLAGSLLTADGVAVACTGDAYTAAALTLGRQIAGAAQYCEIFAIDPVAGAALLSSCGLGDPGLAGRPPVVERTEQYPGRRGAGCTVAFPAADGPATLLAFAPAERGTDLVWMTGRIAPTDHPGMRAPVAMFVPDGDPEAMFERWIASGVVHHHALVAGDRSWELGIVASELGVTAHALGSTDEHWPGRRT